MGLGHRWREAEKMYAEVNQLSGDIVKSSRPPAKSLAT